MSTANPPQAVAGCCLNNVRMADTQRLAELVVARRVQLGHRRRPAFAEAAGISLRTLSDIETGRRANYDPATLAAVEHALNWQTGSIKHILDGGTPTLTITTTDSAGATDALTVTRTTERDAIIIGILERDDISDAAKREIVALLIAQKEADERARGEQAQRLADAFRQLPG